MNRRYAIRQLFVVGSTVWLFPACLSNIEKQDRENTDRETALLAEVAETIIPATDTPGAKDLGIHLFILKMIQECRPKSYQQNFHAGLKKFNAYCRKKTGQTFAAIGTDGRLTLLKQINEDKAAPGVLKTFVSGVRELTITGYSNSEYVMTKLLPYQLIPGFFHGCIPIGPNQNKG